MILTYRKYLCFTVAASVLMLAIVALFNYCIDPYDLMGNNRIGVYFWNERQIKNAILTYDHEAILIGSSKTGYVNPDDLICYKFYNASLRGAAPEEIYHYLKAFLRDEKLVIIAFDFYMFNERQVPLKPISDWKDIEYTAVEYLLGAYTTEASYKTIIKWLNGETIHGMKPNGQIVYPNAPEASKHQVQAKDQEDTPVAVPQKDEERYQDIIKGLVSNHYDEFSFSQKRMAYVKMMKTMLESRKVQYAVLINPLNEDVLAALRDTQAYDEFLHWRKEMATIFPDLYDFASGRYSEWRGFYGNDPYHYMPATGEQFLNEIIRDFCPPQNQ